MKLMTEKDMKSLQYSDLVFKVEGFNLISYRYVGLMPSNERYLIFSCGEKLEWLYISYHKGFSGEWFMGEFDEVFEGNFFIAKHQAAIDSYRARLANKL